jgi:hypothetical protein
MADVATLLAAFQTGVQGGERDLLYSRLGHLPKGLEPQTYKKAKDLKALLDEQESKRKSRPRLGNMIDRALQSLPLNEEVSRESLADLQALKDSVRKIEQSQREALEMYLNYMSARVRSDTSVSAAIGQAARLVTKLLKE